MKIGFVTFWFTRGQAVVSRQIKQVFEQAGHECHVLARPDKLLGRVRNDGEWRDPRLTVASQWAIPQAELLAWAQATRLDVVFFFQNEEFSSIAALRRSGVKTIGTFMWEMLSPGHGEEIDQAFDCVYCLHAAQTDLMSRRGVMTVRVHWGCWPELSAWQKTARDDSDPIKYYYPGGYLERRRPIRRTVKAFLNAGLPNARLLVKSVRPIDPAGRIDHPTVEYVAGDFGPDDYRALLSDCDVVLSNTRWEGLGLVFYEAIAMGIPLIAPDFPPMRDNVRHGLTGMLVPCSTTRQAPSGIPAADVSVRALTKAIRAIADRRLIDQFEANTLRIGNLDFSWERTRGDLIRLLDAVAG